MPSGRTTKYTPKMAQYICQELASGRTLRDVCRDKGTPPESTVRLWAIKDRNGFAAQYEEARKIGYMSMADELFEIADDGANDWMVKNDPDNPGYAINGEHVSRSRLRLDTRKWALSKALPKIFGDKLVHAGDEDNPIKTQHEIDVGSLSDDTLRELVNARRNAAKSE